MSTSLSVSMSMSSSPRGGALSGLLGLSHEDREVLRAVFAVEDAVEPQQQQPQQQPQPGSPWGLSPMTATTTDDDADADLFSLIQQDEPEGALEATATAAVVPGLAFASSQAITPMASVVANVTTLSTRVQPVPIPSGQELAVVVAAKSRPNASRNKRREEILYLRGRVQELEEELANLKRKTQATTELAVPRTPQEIQLLSIWEGVADRQYKQRQRAEVENAKLRTMLEEQIKIARSLERLLNKRSCPDLYMPPSLKRKRGWSESSPVCSPTMFDDLLKLVDEMYLDTDVKFMDPRYHTNQIAFREIQLYNDAVTGTVVEIVDKALLPFELAATSKAIWHHFRQKKNHGFGHVDEVASEITTDTISKEVLMSLEHPRFSGHFRGKMAVRRYVEESRVVLVWAACTDPLVISDTNMDGVLIRHKGWTLMEPVTRNGVESTRSMTYHNVSPELLHDEVIDHKRKVGALTNFVINTVGIHLDTGRQMIENLLLEGKLSLLEED